MGLQEAFCRGFLLLDEGTGEGFENFVSPMKVLSCMSLEMSRSLQKKPQRLCL